MWIDAINQKPEINDADPYDKEHRVSKIVVVWLEDETTLIYHLKNYYLCTQ